MEHVAHAVDGRLVGCLLVAPPHERGRRERRRLGHADELQGEIAVGPLGGSVGVQVGSWKARAGAGGRRRGSCDAAVGGHAAQKTYTSAVATTIVA